MMLSCGLMESLGGFYQYATTLLVSSKCPHIDFLITIRPLITLLCCVCITGYSRRFLVFNCNCDVLVFGCLSAFLEAFQIGSPLQNTKEQVSPYACQMLFSKCFYPKHLTAARVPGCSAWVAPVEIHLCSRWKRLS